MTEQNLLLVAGLIISLLIINFLMNLLLLLSIKREIRNTSMGATNIGTTLPPPVPKPMITPIPQPRMTIIKTPPMAKSIQDIETKPKQMFKCNKCSKEFADKTKLQRHIGMAHYMDLEV